jgi:hypothetical protein
VADEQVAFPVEIVPDLEAVLMRTHRSRMKDGLPRASAFEPHGGSMSVDWDRYSTAEETRARASKPQDNAVVSMGVADIRSIKDGLNVTHSPLPNNRAHSEVNLPQDNVEQTEVRVKLSRIARVILPLPS